MCKTISNPILFNPILKTKKTQKRCFINISESEIFIKINLSSCNGTGGRGRTVTSEET